VEVADECPAVVLGAGGREPELPSGPSRRGDVVSTDLIAFLTARLDEDAAASQSATGGPWRAEGDAVFAPNCQPPGFSRGIAVTRASYTGDVLDHPANADHIARHDPARVLREVTAKRAIIATVFAYEAKIDGEWACCHSATEIAAGFCPETRPDDIRALRELAAIWSDHPDYRNGWAS
jgi:hypothetical protein